MDAETQLRITSETYELANALECLIVGHSAIAVGAAFGLVIGAHEAEAKHPDLEGTMLRIARISVHEFERRAQLMRQRGK